MNKTLLSQIAQGLNQARKILITCHIRPDGDAIGSLLGLGLALQTVGKNVQMISVDGIPASYRFLAGSELINTYPQPGSDFIITVDCSDLKRTGNALDGYPAPDLNIDHHITNEYFARINLVDVEAVATAQILASILPLLDIPITESVAAALLTGIITDTLGFRTTNVTPEALRQAAGLLEYGPDLASIYHRTLLQHTFQAAQYWGAGLGRLQRRDGIVWTSLTLADRKKAGYPGKDDADLINLLSAISEMDIAIVFVEQSAGYVKVSWRSRAGIDISTIAQSFGGGGHPNAAGAEIHQPLDDVQEQVLKATLYALVNQVNVG